MRREVWGAVVCFLALVLLHRLTNFRNKLREVTLGKLRCSALLALLFALRFAVVNFDAVLVLENPSADVAISFGFGLLSSVKGRRSRLGRLGNRRIVGHRCI